jgi:hypothetical protein
MKFNSDKISIGQEIYNSWVDAMVCPKNDVHRVLDLYHQNAIVLPTFSPTICTNHDQLYNYFKNLIILPTLSITTHDFLSAECNNLIINSGIYTFQYLSQNRPVIIPARFSFVYKNYDGKWLIINHHSSMLPVQATPF